MCFRSISSPGAGSCWTWPYLDKFRFRSLADPQIWNSAVTNGIFVRFCDVELSHDELLSMAEQEHHRKGGKQYE